MLAQLLGMGRGKREKEKEREKGLANGDVNAEGSERAKQTDPMSNGAACPGKYELLEWGCYCCVWFYRILHDTLIGRRDNYINTQEIEVLLLLYVRAYYTSNTAVFITWYLVLLILYKFSGSIRVILNSLAEDTRRVLCLSSLPPIADCRNGVSRVTPRVA